MIQYPIKTPFGVTGVPALHRNDPEKLTDDAQLIMEDPRFVRNLVAPSGKSLVVFLKTKDGVQLDEAKILMSELEALQDQYAFEDVHYLGRAYFQQELVKMQIRASKTTAR